MNVPARGDDQRAAEVLTITASTPERIVRVHVILMDIPFINDE
jgi:hypothetical protein